MTRANVIARIESLISFYQCWSYYISVHIIIIFLQVPNLVILFKAKRRNLSGNLIWQILNPTSNFVIDTSCDYQFLIIFKWQPFIEITTSKLYILKPLNRYKSLTLLGMFFRLHIFFIQDVPQNNYTLTCCSVSVSYTHLTLPTILLV